ncbi:unnamed protein product [Sphenostylis stenocarpa]|uniref:Uncharacterized protein n=1 Tax=Sphenostylis stenocarpa TaxID=92480 RepID=A0AA86T352_9FABA|nr:unnamed protein product [Sphenostylis stenocarpa]
MADQTPPTLPRLSQTTLKDFIKVNFIQTHQAKQQHLSLPLTMGNAVVTPCLHPKISSSSSLLLSSSKLLFWDGTVRCLKGKHIAGEIMFEFPDKVICHADSFFIGHPIPSLALEDELMVGEAYFVLPSDFLTCKTLSVSSLLSLGSSPNKATIRFGECAFEYLKGSNGRVLIKVMPEFITMLINRGKRCSLTTNHTNFLCSTPELKKHYQMLVKPKDQTWSPKLEPISEYKVRFSPCRFIGLEWKEKEKADVVSSR